MSEQTEQQLEASQQKMTAANESTARGSAQLADALKNLVDLYEDQPYLLKSANKQFGELNKALQSGKKRFVDVGQELENLRETIEKIEDQTEKDSLRKQLKEKETEARKAQYTKIAIDGLASLAAGAAKVYVAVGKSAINSYQSSASGFQAAGDAAIAGLDNANQTVKGIAGVASTVGAGLMFLGPEGIAAGLALQGVSSAASFLSENMTDLAKFGINVAVKELEKTTKSFQTATSAGALFANGLQEMRDLGAQSLLTQDQFAKVISENSAALASFGGSVGQGAKTLSGVTRVLNTDFLPGLMSLGYSIDDVADGAAKYIGMIGKLGITSNKSNYELAQSSADYLTQLKKITAFTGENAKQAEKDGEIAAQNAAVKAKILASQNPEEEAKKFKALIATANGNKDLILAIQQKYTTGVVSNLAVLSAGSEGLLNQLDANVANVQNTNKTLEQFTDDVETNRKTYGAQILAESKQQATNMAAANLHGGKYADTLAILSDSMDNANKTIAGIVKPSIGEETAQAKEAAARDELTKSYVEATLQNQKLSLTIQKDLDPVMKEFGKVAAPILKGIEDQLVKLGIGKPALIPTAPVTPSAYGGIGTPEGGTRTTPGVKRAIGVANRITDLIRGKTGAETPTATGSTGGATSAAGASTIGGKAGIDVIKNLIASVESAGAGGYNATVRMGQQNLTSMSIDEVMKLWDRGSGALGRYQFIKSTLQDLAKDLPGSTKFDSNTQDMLGERLIKQMGYDDYVSGKLPKDQFLMKLASQWRGLPNSPGVTRGSATDNVGNKAGVDWDSAIQKLYTGKSDLKPSDGLSIVGERGPEIIQGSGSVTSTAATSEIFSKMLTKLDRLIAVTESHSSTTTKLLNATV